ncbi:molecular chaperone HtpG [Kallipyga massiliensis]|uniref:molecular chaperone HtpG n=1 Tax=Kallipyga massiliensis TaxID=1472764 RepID=UPI0004B72B7B|nr:molecular chaperone HtpG [Kallipyga massiliensis]
MRKFKAESQKLLDMMIHSIYTNKDVFLRELISNASDALDKRYILDLEEKPSDFDRSSYKIELIPNEEDRTLTVRDYGIGMTEEEMDKNLGTIAHSGTQEFKQSESKEDVASIIGQFGVGFYASFMVAEKVEVVSKSLKDGSSHRWVSEGADGYKIEEADREEVGTDVILHLRKDKEDEDYSRYLSEYTLRSLVEKYSNYIRYSIEMEVSRQKRVPLREDATEEEKKAWEDNPEYEETRETLTLNSKTPIWKQPKKDLKDEDYINFYQQEGLGFGKPLRWIHLVADGTLSYRAILYIPSQVPWDFYTREFKKGLSLYSAGVKIMDHADSLLPDYLSFVQGVVSSEDFKLNLSRETLQEDRQMMAMARRIEKRVLDELKKMMEEDEEAYKTFFALFGTTLKAGIYQSYGAKKDDLAPLLLFDTSLGQGRSLDQIIGEEGEEDEAEEKEKAKILYATGESLEGIRQLPTVQALMEKEEEVVFLTDTIDEFTIKAMVDYKGHAFQSVLSDDFALEGEEKEDLSPEAEELFSAMKELLDGEVVDVKASQGLTHDAAILTAQGDISIEMEKTLAGQPGDMPKVQAQKVLQVNPDHPVVKKLLAFRDQGKEDDFQAYTQLLYDQARIIAGLGVADPVTFTRRIQELM